MRNHYLCQNFILKSCRMKKLILFLSFSMSCFFATSQLPNGSIAPDFNVVDLNGGGHSLYSYLDQGYTVYLDFSATWCGPCWSYHNSHALANLYNQYGPSGTNEVMVLMIEGDSNTPVSALYGAGNTYGNWVAGTPYPIVNDDNLASAYSISYWPTIYAICPDRKVTEMGMAATSTLLAHHQSSCALDYSLVSLTNALCYGEGSGGVNIEMSGQTGNQTYFWSDGSINEDLANVEAGTYFCTVTDGNRRLITDPITIAQPLFPVSVAGHSINHVLCHGESTGVITVSVTGGSGPYFYQWSNGSIGSPIGNLTSGEYALVLTDNNGCKFYDSYTVVEPDPISVQVETLPENCGQEDGELLITAQGGSNEFTYDIGQGSSINPLFNSLGGGTYNVVTTDGNGCAHEELVYVEEIGSPEAEAISSGVLTCTNTEVILDIGSSSQGNQIVYQWIYDGQILSASPSFPVNQAGIYTLQVISVETGCESIAEVVVEQNIQTLAVTLESIGTLTCDQPHATIVANISDSGTFGSTVWYDENGSTLGIGNTLDITEGGTYMFEVVNEENGCPSTQSITIKEDFNYPLAGFVTGLNGYTLNLINISTGSNLSYEWTLSNGWASNDSELLVDLTESGWYTLCLTVENECGTNTHCKEFYFDATAVTLDGKSHHPQNDFQMGNDGNTGGLKVKFDKASVHSTHIFPNPARTAFQISTTSDLLSEVTIINLAGKEMYRTYGVLSFEVQTSDWDAGIYLISMKNSEGSTIHRVVVQ